MGNTLLQPGINENQINADLMKMLHTVGYYEDSNEIQVKNIYEAVYYIHEKYEQKLSDSEFKMKEICAKIKNVMEECGVHLNLALNNEKQNMDQFIESLANAIKGLKNRISDLENKVNLMQNYLGPELELDLAQRSENNQEQFETVINKLQQFKEFESKIKNGKGERTILNPLEHYDTVIKAETFKELMYDGWPIYKQIDTGNIPQSSVVTVIGNFGKGKSFIVKYLSGQEIAIGHNIHTEGPSCIYPRNNNNPVTFLDTAGLGEPLRIKLEMEKLKKFKNSNKFRLNKDTLPEEEDSKKLKNNFDQEAIDLLKDKQYVEDFLQRFLLDTSNFILIIVSQLTFPDQKLIKRILNEYISKKKIFIIHNLYNLYTIEDVKKAIKNDILDVFDVNPVIIPFYNEQKNVNREYYVSNLCKSDCSDIAHVVMARDGTEAGNYYNESAKELLLAMVKGFKPKSFILEEALGEFISKNLHNYIDNITSSEYIIEEINNNSNDVDIRDYIKASDLPILPVGLLKLKCPKENIEFRKVTFDDFGFLTFYNCLNEKISLPYKITENTNSLNLIMELPGFKDQDILNNFSVQECYSSKGFYFQINGKKVEAKLEDIACKTIYSNINYGNIKFHTIIAGKQEQIKNFVDIESPEVDYEDGILTYTWKKKKTKRMQPILRLKKV